MVAVNYLSISKPVFKFSALITIIINGTQLMVLSTDGAVPVLQVLNLGVSVPILPILLVLRLDLSLPVLLVLSLDLSHHYSSYSA